jgi:hypothetical protein
MGLALWTLPSPLTDRPPFAGRLTVGLPPLKRSTKVRPLPREPHDGKADRDTAAKAGDPGRSSAWLEYRTWNAGAVSSNLTAQTTGSKERTCKSLKARAAA